MTKLTGKIEATCLEVPFMTSVFPLQQPYQCEDDCVLEEQPRLRGEGLVDPEEKAKKWMKE